jgi:hypothetical protein
MRHSRVTRATGVKAAPLIVLRSERRFLNGQWDRPPPRTAPSCFSKRDRPPQRDGPAVGSVARATIGRIHCAVKSKPLPDAVSTLARRPQKIFSLQGLFVAILAHREASSL